MAKSYHRNVAKNSRRERLTVFEDSLDSGLAQWLHGLGAGRTVSAIVTYVDGRGIKVRKPARVRVSIPLTTGPVGRKKVYFTVLEKGIAEKRVKIPIPVPPRPTGYRLTSIEFKAGTVKLREPNNTRVK